ncbi:short chain dehydrogenase [Pandoraea terrae]|uniref:Short chain dehydrogenase n=1 Tax=Pandoraea terrae TaxID=1537710 RepID=A0A5E4XD54_9BURK|nr:SDR family oxidoreductase [Pandoraea terrae]VVE34058.1 short chain dehydrogenase [Pandoraea terrae]
MSTFENKLPPHPAAPAFDFQGRTVLVTGGLRGIGRAIVEAFLGAGADVFFCGRRPPSDDPQVIDGDPEASLPAVGGRAAHFVQADIREPAQIETLIARVREAAGRLDVLVHNAGGSPYGLMDDLTPRRIESILRLNLIAPLQLARDANVVMQAQPEGGVQLFIGSVSALRPSPGTTPYGAAKAGILNAVRSLAVEWAPKVRVMAVSPGLVMTASAREGHFGDPAAVERIAGTIPLARMAEPEDIASACLFLASPGAAYVSGQNLTIDGGGERPAFLNALEAGA